MCRYPTRPDPHHLPGFFFLQGDNANLSSTIWHNYQIKSNQYIKSLGRHMDLEQYFVLLNSSALFFEQKCILSRGLLSHNFNPIRTHAHTHTSEHALVCSGALRGAEPVSLPRLRGRETLATLAHSLTHSLTFHLVLWQNDGAP